MSEFRVGDRVRCNTWYDPGEVGRISQIDDGAYLITYDDGEAYVASVAALTPADPPAPSGDRPTSADDGLTDDEKLKLVRDAADLRWSGVGGWGSVMMATHIRFLLARLDAVTKERDQLRQRNDYLRARLNVYLQESTDD